MSKSQYIPVEMPSGLVWVEISEQDDIDMESIAQVSVDSDRKAQLTKKFEDAVEAVKINSEHIISSLKGLKPQEIEVSCAIKLAGEKGNVFWGFAKATGEGTFTVKVKWAENSGKVRRDKTA